MKLRSGTKIANIKQISHLKYYQSQVEVREVREKEKTRVCKNKMNVMNMFQILIRKMKQNKREMGNKLN